MEESLKDLGLTANEIKLYLTLLDLGENTVGPLIKKLKIHRQVAYDALEGLIERNMVTKTSKNNRFYFRVSDPSNILNNIKYQETLAKKLVKEVNSKLANKTEKQEVKIIEGEEAYKEWVIQGSQLMPENSKLYVVASGMTEWENMMLSDKTLEKINEIRNKRNIKTKMIYNENAREKIGKIEKTNYENRFIDNKFTLPTEFAISPDAVEFVSFGSDLLVIIVKSMKLRNDYLKYFNNLWKIAKK